MGRLETVLLVCVGLCVFFFGVGYSIETEKNYCTQTVKDLTLKVDDPSFETMLMFKGNIFNPDEDNGFVEKAGRSYKKWSFPKNINVYVAKDFGYAIVENSRGYKVKLPPGACKMEQLQNLVDHDFNGPFDPTKRLGDELASHDPYIIPWDIFNDALIDDWDWDWEMF